MLIYMEAPLQKLIELFNYSLLSGGIMILGSWRIHNNEGFEVLDTKLKFYKRTHISLSSELTDFPSSFQEVKVKIKK
jgi:two-component system CheB/CheR fusion protein